MANWRMAAEGGRGVKKAKQGSTSLLHNTVAQDGTSLIRFSNAFVLSMRINCKVIYA